MRKFIEKYYPILVVLLLIIMITLEIGSALQESQTVDEGVHLAAGYSYLMKRDFRMNTEHPPLLKEISALPLIIINYKLKSPFDSPAWTEYNQWQFAKDFIYNNNISADTILLLGRLPTMLLSLILGIFVFIWSRQLFGTLAGLFSLSLYSFSPNIIAHSRYITTDLGLALFFFLTIYYFCKYLKISNKKNLVLTAIFFGLAMASKFSAVILIPILLLLFFIRYLKNKKYSLEPHFWRKFIITFLVFSLISAAIIFIVYGFEIKKPIEDKNISRLYEQQDQIINNNEIEEQTTLIQKAISITHPQSTSGKIIKNIATSIRIPAFSYLNGLTKLYLHNYSGHTSYLIGNYSNYGWWYYFPLAFIIKTPLTTLIFLFMLLIGVGWLIIKHKYYKFFRLLFNKIPLYIYCLILPPLLYLIWSMTGNLNLGIRHILLIYPFIFVIFGVFMTIHLKRWQIVYLLLISGLMIFYIVSSVLVYPYYLAYFNEAIGGPSQGSKYLVDSNIDWGQDVKRLKEYMDENKIDYVCLSYFGQAKLEYYGIDYRYLPTTQHFQGIETIDCVVAISVTSLLSKEREYSWLLEFIPDEKIGYSIHIYDFRQKETPPF